jgi:hypothetical protein
MPQASGADLATWDQVKITALAEEIAQAARELRDSLRRQPPPSLGQSGRRAFWALREEMQVLVSASRRLHGALADGAGQEETFSTYRRLLATARRAEREARRIDLGEPALGKIRAAAEAIRRIRPFYEAEPPL